MHQIYVSMSPIDQKFKFIHVNVSWIFLQSSIVILKFYISLINMDLKVYAKLLSCQLQNLTPSINNLDQVSFGPLCEDCIITIKTLSLISYPQKTKIPMCLLSLDAKNEFDHLESRFTQLPQVADMRKSI